MCVGTRIDVDFVLRLLHCGVVFEVLGSLFGGGEFMVGYYWLVSARGVGLAFCGVVGGWENGL